MAVVFRERWRGGGEENWKTNEKNHFRFLLSPFFIPPLHDSSFHDGWWWCGLICRETLMDPHSFIARAEAQRWLGIAEKLLMGHDLVGSKTFAIRARESDPRLEAADQILAINDTLLAAEKRVVGTNGTQQPDFYAILQLVRFAQDTEHIASQYRRLAVMLNPHQNRFPYSDQAFQLVNDAWAVLSNPMRKSMYDSELDFPPQQQINPIGFNLEQQQHHQEQQQHHQEQQHQHQQHHNQQQQQQQQQHNFFSINHIGSGHDQELPESQQTFQTRVQQSHQHQQLQQHNFLSQNPVRPVPVREQEQLFQQREQEQLFQPQVQPFQVTSPPQQQTRPPPQPPQPQPPMQPPTPPPPAAPPQPPLSWPQASPLSPPLQQPQPKHVQPQPQQQLQQKELQQQLQEEQQHHQHQQQESLEQNAAPVQLPSQVNTNNGVREEEEETEVETEEAAEDVDDDLPTFWTACPYCFYMYEYPRVYAGCTLRCDNCKRAFQAVRIRSPPPMIEGQEASFYCWGFFPLGVSMSRLPKNNSTGSNSSWTPFSSLYDVTRNVQDHLNGRAAPKKNFVVNKNSGPRVYIDDVADDIFVGISDPSDSSDVEWNSSKKKKVKRMKIDLRPAYKKRAQVIAVRVRDGRSGSNKNLQNGIADQEGVGVPTVSVAESTKKAVGSNQRRQSGRVAKELGKLDLNVEFNNNEGEEPAPQMIVGNRGNGQGEEDNIEGIGFFEGLDEFLSSLPILSVVNDEKVKAA
ncbi:hypothetical protein L6452_01231 [Arctium lappa]|uniref:Uncharacterized protein n=1 Tax=Arctium lappa TaxID=4217 RepID=A0ACB9FFJ9_ARCLA|nr:hypothetical protein L6452_01231 [Arctium lappa]